MTCLGMGTCVAACSIRELSAEAWPNFVNSCRHMLQVHPDRHAMKRFALLDVNDADRQGYEGTATAVDCRRELLFENLRKLDVAPVALWQLQHPRFMLALFGVKLALTFTLVAVIIRAEDLRSFQFCLSPATTKLIYAVLAMFHLVV
eukprot:TRINITY_DN72383_c0_g1_i1.p4 TRINITY_DN72383_c0_g1~~TRINITY_DN72383_c0_g1_i1.p4  ORF type:complete len:147 (-),score=16.04 TRINITY_DN72383_c0_g1_i1:1246-1686(-)